MGDASEWITPSLKGRTPPLLESIWDAPHITEEEEEAAAEAAVEVEEEEDADETRMTVATTETTDTTDTTSTTTDTVGGALRHRTTAATGPVLDHAPTAHDDTEAVNAAELWRMVLGV